MKKHLVLVVFLVTGLIASALAFGAQSQSRLTAQPVHPIDTPVPPPPILESQDTDRAARDIKLGEFNNYLPFIAGQGADMLTEDVKQVQQEPAPTNTPDSGQQLPAIAFEQTDQSASREMDLESFDATAVLEPSQGWTTYKDINIGFSFSYPSNWVLSEPDTVLDGAEYKYYQVTLTNFNPKRHVRSPTDHMMMEFVVLLKPVGYTSLNEWLHATSHPETQFQKAKSLNKEGSQMEQWAIQSPTAGNTVFAGMEYGNKIVYVSYTPASTKYASIAERVLNSFALR